MTRRSRRLYIPLGILVAIIAAWLILPTLVVVPLSFSARPSYVFPPVEYSTRWYQNMFTDQRWLGSVKASAVVAVVAIAVTVVVGTAAAVAASRMGGRARAVVTALMLAPAIVPAIVLAVAAYSLLLNLGLTGTYLGFISVHVVLGLPLMFVSTSSSIAMFDERLELAAASLGASRSETLRRVTVPLIAPGIAAGSLLVTVISLDEAVVSSFIASASLVTMPVKMFQAVLQDTDPTIAVISSLVLVIVVLGATFLLVRSGGMKALAVAGRLSDVDGAKREEANANG